MGREDHSPFCAGGYLPIYVDIKLIADLFGYMRQEALSQQALSLVSSVDSDFNMHTCHLCFWMSGERRGERSTVLAPNQSCNPSAPRSGTVTLPRGSNVFPLWALYYYRSPCRL